MKMFLECHKVLMISRGRLSIFGCRGEFKVQPVPEDENRAKDEMDI